MPKSATAELPVASADVSGGSSAATAIVASKENANTQIDEPTRFSTKRSYSTHRKWRSVGNPVDVTGAKTACAILRAGTIEFPVPFPD
jgi:hypothetical protein